MADDGIFSSLTRGAKFKGNSVLKATRKRALGNSGARNKKIDFGQLDFFGSNQPPTSVEASTTKKSTVSKPPRKEHVTAQGLDENSNADQPATKKRTRRSKKRKGNKLVENDTDSSNIQLFSASVKAKQAQVAKPADPAEKNAREAHAQEISTFRNRIGIKVNGNGAMADPISTFGEMEKMEALQDKTTIVHVLLRNIELSKYEEPTPIQMQSIPTMLQGRDVVARAPTGSGKTAAFLIPLIIRLNVPMRKGGIRALVVAPTRELAVQILREFTRLTEGKKFKASVLRKSTAASIAQQASASNSGESSSGDLLVATPLRLVNMIKSKQIGLDNVETVVFDEADKLFEMGFLEQVDEIIAALNVSRKTGDVPALKAMFSATMPPQVETLARSVMLDPVTITCGANLAGANTIQQELLFVGQEEGKILAFRQLLQQGKLKPPVMVFVQSKERAKALHEELLFDGIRVDAVHAERSETKRDALVKRFRTGETWFLIATDLMGRGIDFKNVNCVVNYDFPTSAISYVHRIGRTGRAGRKGTAITFFTNADMEYLRSIANVMKISGCPVPEWMLHLKKQKSKDKRALEKKPPTRSTIDTMVTKYDKLKQDKKRNMIAMSKKRKLEQNKKSS